LVTVLQFAEGLLDRQAADAVRARIDWKYALGLELTDPGFHYSVLNEFRQRLLEGQQAQALLEVQLTELKQRGLLKARGRQRTDSTHVLAAVRQLNRLELVGETMRQALNELAAAVPDWLSQIAPPEWFTRYGQRFDAVHLPRERAEREALLLTIGQDGYDVLTAVNEAPEAEWLRRLPGVETLRQMGVQQYWIDYPDDGPGQMRLRTDENQPPGEQRLHSPYDLEARYSAKRATAWVGYKAHLAETCEDNEVHLITHVETTAAVLQDVSMAAEIQSALARKDLLTSEHLLDAGYVTAELLVEAERDLGIRVCGPVKKDVRWQANTGQGFGLADFQVDWQAQTVTCPNGQKSCAWSEQHNAYGRPVIQVKFKPSVCQACRDQTQCTRSKRGARNLVLLPQAQHEALQQVRKAQTTSEFRKAYAKRSGIEGTISQAVRAYELRRARYIGLAKTHLQMLATAVAINLHRLFDWLSEVPRSITRVSRFAGLAPDPALVPVGWRF
jgi:transposase